MATASAMDDELFIPNTADDQFYHGQTGDAQLGAFLGGSQPSGGNGTNGTNDTGGGSPLVMKGGYIPVCGDGNCVTGEDCRRCPDDCGACPVNETPRPVEPPITGDATKGGFMTDCGDEICGMNEDCRECPKDCGSCDLPILIIEAPSEVNVGDVITIMVKDKDGNPVSGAELIIVYPSEKRDSFITNENGVYRTESKEKGQILLNANKEGYQVSRKQITVNEIKKEVPRFFEAVSSINWWFILLAVLLVVGILGYYIYSYRSRAGTEIDEIDRKLKELMRE